MNYKGPIFSFAILIYSFLLFFSFFSEGKAYFELIIALTPYLIALNLFILIFFFSKKRISTLFLLISTLILISRFLTFSFLTPSGLLIPPVTASEGQNIIKMAFLNKLYSNTNYLEIDKKVKDLDLDFIGFSEFKTIDKDYILSLSEYPYVFSAQSRDNSTLAFFSKYPTVINSDAPDLGFCLSVKMEINEKLYSVFIIHPVPPINDDWVEERNRQLEALASYIQSLPNQNTILMGDFNLTPWSQFYQKISANLSFLQDSAQGKGIYFTWNSGLIGTQIDHIFVPVSSKVHAFNSVNIAGSDHNLIWAQITL